MRCKSTWTPFLWKQGRFNPLQAVYGLRDRRLGACDERRKSMLKIAVIFLLGLAQAIAAQTLVGRVVGVHDGDTITVLDGGKKQHRIRQANPVHRLLLVADRPCVA